MNFDLTEEQKIMVQIVKDFTDKRNCSQFKKRRV